MTTVFLREVVISLSQVFEKHQFCPGCGDKSVTTLGQFVRTFQEQFIDGKLEQKTLAPDYSEAITDIICLKCSLKFHILPDNEYHDHKELLDSRAAKVKQDSPPVEPKIKPVVM